ncbi:hypothetical protein PCANC_08889 [Puccinia coronata f. sp. avenae]|uniref:Uncharacterized protein n=1 Tax=Puccinia coronata f. sp. avenae TaxID=200324 RepID=A0A2N5VS53_9BASI|nr:hypothetical protein PCASD_10377 [Puccinia coronata f. sp. avenae]PLW52824.1 hypothetical protein PCANC_08889 [Puccinia coronata f. sp. avenae]
MTCGATRGYDESVLNDWVITDAPSLKDVLYPTPALDQVKTSHLTPPLEDIPNAMTSTSSQRLEPLSSSPNPTYFHAALDTHQHIPPHSVSPNDQSNLWFSNDINPRTINQLPEEYQRRLEVYGGTGPP